MEEKDTQNTTPRELDGVQDPQAQDPQAQGSRAQDSQAQDPQIKDEMTPQALTPAEMRRRNAEIYKDKLSELPRFNLGAFCLPVIWGPAHGMWITLLFYPLLIFVDSVNRGALVSPTLSHILLACICSLVTLAFMIFFAMTAQPYAYFRVAHKVSVETYKKRQVIWAIVDTIIAVVVIALATYYNLAIYLPAQM